MPKPLPTRKNAKRTQQAQADTTAARTFVAKDCFQARREKSTLPIFVVNVADYATWLVSAPSEIQAWLSVNQFKPKAGACALLPQEEGCAGVVITVSDPLCLWDYAGLVRVLPPGSYEAEPELEPQQAAALCLGWLLSSYHFDRYKQKPRTSRRTLVWPEGTDQEFVLSLGEGVCLARDLVNTPAADMGPAELAAAGVQLAKEHGAKASTIVGDALLSAGYPMVHAVGRASSRDPRLLDLRWGKSTHPLVTLVGKGVCFDTGGLDIKPAQYMKLMKKDMGGAALVLGLAHAIMRQNLPIQLRVLIPAVENSVSGNAMRPLDVLPTRKGITVEVGDTDAEGRLILGDVLFEAAEEKPDLVIDAATLTGAARVALGPEVPVVFANRDATWELLQSCSDRTYDPMWRLPLYEGYRRKLESKVADLSNISPEPYAGAITAALFLREFVRSDTDWVHVDTMGYNTDSRPGRPAGGEGLALMALFALLRERYKQAPAEASSAAKRSARSARVSKTTVRSTAAPRTARKAGPGARTRRKSTLH